MDTSETYIRMCQKATEIQAGEEVGGVWLTTLGDDILFHHETRRYYHVEDTYCTRTCPDCGHSDDHIASSVNTWLPTQDQLQAMCELPLSRLWWDFEEFLSPLVFADDFDGKTSEQLWLAFVMAEKYGKTWNGEDWR